MTVYIDTSPGKGRGVFAAKDFKKGETIEKCPVVVMPRKDHKLIDASALSNYIFAWGKKDQGYAVVLGYGSIYNHSHENNAEFDQDMENKQMVFKAAKDIKRGDEICTDYGWEPGADDVPGWYVPAKDEEEDEESE